MIFHKLGIIFYFSLNLCYFSDFFLMGENMIWTENASNYLSHTMNSAPFCLTFTAYPIKANAFLLAIILNGSSFRLYLSPTLNLHQYHCISRVLFCYPVCVIGIPRSHTYDFGFIRSTYCSDELILRNDANPEYRNDLSHHYLPLQ